MILTFHTAPEQEWGLEQGQGRMGGVPIYQVLKLFQVVCFNCISMASRCPVLVPDTASPSRRDSQCEYTISVTVAHALYSLGVIYLSFHQLLTSYCYVFLCSFYHFTVFILQLVKFAQVNSQDIAELF